jgi:hypothetical protein
MPDFNTGDTFKFRLEHQHMWFEVVKVLPEAYRAKLLNQPFRDLESGIDHSNNWGDVITLPKADVHEYRGDRRGISGVISGGRSDVGG